MREKPTTTLDSLRQLAAHLKKSGVALIVAPDKTRRERSVSFLMEELQKTCSWPSLPQIQRISVDKTSYEKVGLQLRNGSLFDPQRAFVLTEWDKLPKNTLETFLENMRMLPQGTYVFLFANEDPPAGSYVTRLKKEHCILELNELKGATLARWIERELKMQGIASWDDSIVELISEGSAGDLDYAVQMIGLLSLYSVTGEQLNEATFEKLFPNRLQSGDFALVDALVANDVGTAERLIHAAVDRGTSAFSLLGLLSKSLVSIQRIRQLLDRGMDTSEIRSTIGSAPWLFSKQLQSAKRKSIPDLDRSLKTLLGIDSRLKNRSLPPEALLSDLRDKLHRN